VREFIINKSKLLCQITFAKIFLRSFPKVSPGEKRYIVFSFNRFLSRSARVLLFNRNVWCVRCAPLLCQHFSFLRQLASGKQSIMQSRRGIHLIFYLFLGMRKAVSRNLISTECGEFKSRTDQKSENMFSIRYLGPCNFYTDICIRILLKNCDNWSIFLYQIMSL